MESSLAPDKVIGSNFHASAICQVDDHRYEAARGERDGFFNRLDASIGSVKRAGSNMNRDILTKKDFCEFNTNARRRTSYDENL